MDDGFIIRDGVKCQIQKPWKYTGDQSDSAFIFLFCPLITIIVGYIIFQYVSIAISILWFFIFIGLLILYSYPLFEESSKVYLFNNRIVQVTKRATNIILFDESTNVGIQIHSDYNQMVDNKKYAEFFNKMDYTDSAQFLFGIILNSGNQRIIISKANGWKHDDIKTIWIQIHPKLVSGQVQTSENLDYFLSTIRGSDEILDQ